MYGYPNSAITALNACCRYYHVSEEIKRVTRQIGDATCTAPTEGKVVFDTSTIGVLDRTIENCIDRHYYGPIPFSEMCAACKDKHVLIQHRKHLRQQLGAAKRWINAIGKKEKERVTTKY